MQPLNLPNYLTLSRIASIPLLLLLLSPKLPWVAQQIHALWLIHPGTPELLAAGIVLLGAITDILDGYLARRRHQVTTLGMLLDPLSDKLMIAGAFIALVQYNPSIVPAWIAVLVIAREFLVSGLRSIASSEGFTIEASELGKLKMVVQTVAIIATILHHYWLEMDWFVFKVDVELTARIAMWFMVAISLISAFDYFWGFWTQVSEKAQKSRLNRPVILSRRKRHDMQAQENLQNPGIEQPSSQEP